MFTTRILGFISIIGLSLILNAEPPKIDSDDHQYTPAARPTTDAFPAHAPPAVRALHTLFERYEGGSAESEAALISGLANKFAQSQVGIGARVGKNIRGTHAKGVCIDGTFTFYDLQEEFLKKGPFGKFPNKTIEVPIRFADASSTLQPNSTYDVRSVSFTLNIDGQKQQFSMNNDPVFTFGNLTDFNNFMAFMLMAGPMEGQKAQGLISAEDFELFKKSYFEQNKDVAMSVMKALKLGTAQRNKDVFSYHTENYGSGTAFMYGANQAAKFNLVRCEGKEVVRQKIDPNNKEEFLVSRLKQVVENTPEEICFELQVELLDAENMKNPDGKKLEAWQWVEDPTLNWTAAGAKSYSVGKLQGKPGTLKAPEVCDDVKRAYDVNTHSFADLKPLGRINRARAKSEHQSAGLRNTKPAVMNEPQSKFDTTVTIDQGWNDKIRDSFWFTPQGSYIIPYDWFMALNDPNKKGTPLHKNLESSGLINTDYTSELNPDMLPIGVTKEAEPEGNFPHLKGKGAWVGVTCAACHTGAVTVDGKRFIIEGAPAKTDFEQFSLRIENAMKPIIDDENEFFKFKTAVEARGGKVNLADVKEVYQRFSDRNTRSFFHGGDRSKPTVNAGSGRTDAFSVILNEVNSRVLGIPKNAQVANAPVSFPQIWGAPFLKWIQYSGLSNNAFTRNIGEVLGVFGDINLDPKSKDYMQTTARPDNLQVLEHHMRSLKAPKWNQVFGEFSEHDKALIKKGSEIFNGDKAKCSECHGHEQVRELGKFEEVEMVPATEFGSTFKRNNLFTGTDPWYFGNLKYRFSNVSTGALEGTSVLGEMIKRDPSMLERLRFSDDERDPELNLLKRGPKGQKFMDTLTQATPFGAKENGVRILAQATLGLGIKYMIDNGIPIDTQDPKYLYLTGGAVPESQPNIGAFKARDLSGIWATAPYLHNGSVRTLEQMLTPPHEREQNFYVGGMDYDTEAVGYKSSGQTLFRANKMGDLGIGHTFGTNLSPEEKKALIMYLKSL